MTRSKIVRVMRRYHDRMGLSDMPGARMYGCSWRRVDVTLHELAHAIDLGLDLRDCKLRDMNSINLEGMPKRESEDAEYRAHAISRLVLDAYAVPLPWLDQMRDLLRNFDRVWTDGSLVERRVRSKMKTKRVTALAAKLCAFIEEEAAR